MRRTIKDFLINEWRHSALLGDKPEKAYFVKCDRSTMTQNDIDNGRLVCFIGVAPFKPAEFVTFRIGQWTVDRKVCASGAGEPSGASLSTAYAG
jgi:phage tail sheath protein FI